jgi:cytoskeletal protein RodZ
LLSFGPEGLTKRSHNELANPELRQRITGMKHLLSGVAIVGVLAIAAPVSAQQTSSPPSTPPAGASAPAAPAPSAETPAAEKPAAETPAAPAPSAAAPAAPSAPMTTSAAPPKPTHKMVKHRVVVVHRHVVHHYVAAGNRVTEQLNREELERVTAGNTTAPPVTKP